MPSDQELADDVEAILRGDKKCVVCGRFAKPAKVQQERLTSAEYCCDYCWEYALDPSNSFIDLV